LSYNSTMQEFSVGAKDAGLRVDVFVSNKYPQFARAALSVLFDKDIVLINGKIAKAGEKIKKNDLISLDESRLFSKPQEISLPIIYKDSNVIVINKPAGILTHSKGSINTEASVATFIAPYLNYLELLGNRAGIVHRLDRATSGVIITANNSETMSYLQKQFSQRKTKKTYYAIVEGWPEPEVAIIDAPIERNAKKPQTFKVGTGGKTAQTPYKVIKKFEINGAKYAFLELKPVTGRTHQLRVHMSYIKHPIVGDRVYGHNGEHMYLHAASLEITLPGGIRKTFEAPLPKIFTEFMQDGK
jgi:23S rRNA pseudouridine1911/1915/1917 synthase